MNETRGNHKNIGEKEDPEVTPLAQLRPNLQRKYATAKNTKTRQIKRAGKPPKNSATQERFPNEHVNFEQVIV